MPRFKFVPETQASWMEYMYHGEIAVRKGEAETDDPLTIDYLLRHGFVEVADEPAEEAVEATATEDEPAAPVQARTRRKSRKADDEDAQPAE